MQVERMLPQDMERNDGKRLFVPGREHDRRGRPRLVGFAPRGGAHAPAVAGLEARKAVFGRWRDEVVATRTCERQKFGGHLHAYDVESQVFGAGVAATVAIKAGARR